MYLLLPCNWDKAVQLGQHNQHNICYCELHIDYHKRYGDKKNIKNVNEHKNDEIVPVHKVMHLKLLFSLLLGGTCVGVNNYHLNL